MWGCQLCKLRGPLLTAAASLLSGIRSVEILRPDLPATDLPLESTFQMASIWAAPSQIPPQVSRNGGLKKPLVGGCRSQEDTSFRGCGMRSVPTTDEIQSNKASGLPNIS